jgi:regulatory protein
MTMRRDKSPPPPLDAAMLDRLALRYVERFATTRGKLRDYLRRKIRERGWDGQEAADVAGLADRMAELGYIDDRSFAEARVRAMGQRGLGERRISGALRAAGIEGEDSDAVQPSIEDQAEASAIAFARRRRIGPFARGEVDRTAHDRAIGAMLRAGHDFDRSRRILAMTPQDVDRFDAESGDER